MYKELLILGLLNVLISPAFAQKYTAADPDKIAVFYLYCNDLSETDLTSQEDLEKYFFGNPANRTTDPTDNYYYIKGEGGPIANFWKDNFDGLYHYQGRVFRIQLPVSEEEFSEPGSPFLVRKMKKKLATEEEKRLGREEDRLEVEKDRMKLETYRYEHFGYFHEYDPEGLEERINEQKNKLRSQQITLTAELAKLEEIILHPETTEPKKSRLSTEKTRLQEEQRRLNAEQERLDRELQADFVYPAPDEIQLERKKTELQAGAKTQKEQAEEQKGTIPQPPLQADGFKSDKFDKILYVIGEKSPFSTGRYGIVFEDPRFTPFKININEETDVSKPTISCEGIRVVDKFCLSSVQDQKLERFSNCDNEFDLWGTAGGYAVIHEWGHSFNLFHAAAPCGDENCDRKYASASREYFQFNAQKEGNSPGSATIKYGSLYDFMGSRFGYSMMFNAGMRDKTKMMPDLKTINESQSDVQLSPYNQKTGNTIPRAAVIQVTGRRSLPVNLVEIDDLENITPAPTAEVKLYIEYRRAKSYDENLESEVLARNTKGLMVNLAFANVNINAAEDRESITASYQENTWLLDMTPHDGLQTVTLNKGSVFHHAEWGITIQNVRPDKDNGVLFDVVYEEKEGLGSDVYRTAFYAGDYLTPGDRPLLYSSDFGYKMEFEDGGLVIKQMDDDRVMWRGVDQGIPKELSLDKMEFKDGELILSAAGKNHLEQQNGRPPQSQIDHQ